MGGGELIKKGWLVKSPPLESSGMKSWRKRWFCLRSSKVLEYYKNETSSDLKGVINLEDCTSVHASLFHRKYKHVFDIQTQERTFYLVASTVQDMNDWVKTICEVCGFFPTDENTKNVATVDSENTPPPAGNKRLSLTLPNNFSIRSSPLPPIPTEEDTTVAHRLLTIDQDKRSSNPNKVQVHVPPGTSLTDALIAKGYRSPSVVSSNSVSQENVTLECYVPRPPDKPSYLENIGFQTYDTPDNFSPKVPDWYDVPRSLKNSAPIDEPHYMVPRHALLQKADSANSQWATPPNNIYDYPPPPRLANNIYDVPPPPRLAYTATPNYDYLPPPRLADPPTHIYDVPPTSDEYTDSSNIVRLPPRPLSDPPEIFRLLPPRSPENFPDSAHFQDSTHNSAHLRDSTDDPAHSSGYVNLRLLNDACTSDEDVPPPIDRSNKPQHRPSIDRTTKPILKQVRQHHRVSSPSEDEDDDSGIVQGSSCSPSESSFSPREVPKLTRTSIRYCHVTFPKKPVPTPRTKSPGNSPPTFRKVNYVDVDLSATAKLCNNEEVDGEIENDENGEIISKTLQSLQVTNL